MKVHSSERTGTPRASANGKTTETRRRVTLKNAYGLHARTSMMFVEAASRYASDVFVAKDENEVNGKSILALMTLVAPKGTVLEIRAAGEDAEECLEALAALAESGFDEE